MGSEYAKSTHRIGKISTIVALVLIFMVPVVVTAVYHNDIDIDIPATLNALAILIAIYGPVAIVEVVSFSPVLGMGGTYLSFITGNIMNMKLPAASNALAVNNVKRGTEEAEVISTLAIGASSIVTTLVVFLGMLFLGNLLVPVITSPAMAPAFNNVTPALLGALAAQAFVKDVKLAILPVVASVGAYLVMGNEYMATKSTIWMLPFLIAMFGCYVLMYKTGIIKEEAPQKTNA